MLALRQSLHRFQEVIIVGELSHTDVDSMLVSHRDSIVRGSKVEHESWYLERALDLRKWASKVDVQQESDDAAGSYTNGDESHAAIAKESCFSDSRKLSDQWDNLIVDVWAGIAVSKRHGLRWIGK